MVYVAPRQLTPAGARTLPSGEFLLPVCTTKERFAKMISALWYSRTLFEEDEWLDHMIDVLKAMENIQEGCEPSFTTENDCRDYTNDSGIIQFAPTNPFSAAQPTPDGYIRPPFIVVSELFDNIDFIDVTGLKAGDVLVVPDSLPLGFLLDNVFSNIIEFIQALNDFFGDIGMPRFRLQVVGQGTVELHLVQFPIIGGMALVVVDGDAAQATTIDLNKDLVSMPPELASETIHEIVFDTFGLHTIDVTFLPVLDDSIAPPLRYGGGIRSINLCGLVPEITPVTDPCCPEEIDLLTGIYNLLRGGASVRFDLPVPAPQPAPDCAPDLFDGNEGDDAPELALRAAALCLAARRLVTRIVAGQMKLAGIKSRDLNALVENLEPLPVGSFEGFRDTPAGWLNTSSDYDALVTTNLFENIVCCLVTYWRAKQVNLVQFKAGMTNCPPPLLNLSSSDRLKRAVNETLQIDVNYSIFALELERAYEDYKASPADYPATCCTDCLPPELVVITVTNGTVERVAGETDIFIITLTAGLINGGSESGFKVGFTTNACVKWQYLEALSGEATGNLYNNRIDCDGVAVENGSGGGGLVFNTWGGCGKSFYQESNTALSGRFRLLSEEVDCGCE